MKKYFQPGFHAVEIPSIYFAVNTSTVIFPFECLPCPVAGYEAVDIASYHEAAAFRAFQGLRGLQRNLRQHRSYDSTLQRMFRFLYCAMRLPGAMVRVYEPRFKISVNLSNE